MPITTLSEQLKTARRERYAVGQFNVVNHDFFEAIMDAAEASRSPVIVAVAEVHFPFCRLAPLYPAIKERVESSSIPVALHLDHGLSVDSVLDSLDEGFTSAMFDGSALPYKENVEKTRRVVEACRTRGVSVEAELGAVGGDEGGGLESEADPSLFTDPEQAREFVQTTGVDALAVAIGNAHGKYKREPKLDLDRLADVAEATRLPLVLHGGSGIPDADMRGAIERGIAKINFFTGMAQGAAEATADYLKNAGGKYNDYPEMLASVKRRVTDIVRAQMALFGSEGKA